MPISRSRTITAALLLLIPAWPLIGQDSARRPPAWAATLELGGFVKGNGAAVTQWLRNNAYGVDEPEHCGFDLIFRRVCDAPVPYPRSSGSGVIAVMGSVRRQLTDRFALELLGASEQSGTITGRCDDVASPKDPRCTSRFVDIRFSGGSVALIPVVNTHSIHIGAGPAVLFANWVMKPAHLAGVWCDASYEHGTFPLIVHAQYRIYRSTTFSPSGGFSGFHPSTLYVGLGFIARTDNASQ